MAKQLGLTLPLQKGNNGYFQTTTDILTQVKSDLINLLLTRRGERIMQPLFGCDLQLLVFEPNSDDGLASINATIQTAVQNWLPFLKVNDVSINKDIDNNKVIVNVNFTLLSNNITDEIILIF